MNHLCQNFSIPKIPFTFIKPDQCFESADLKAVHQSLDRINIVPGLALCTGEPGSGKTYAVSAWAATLNPNSVDIPWIYDAGTTVSSFLKRVARTMNLEPEHHAEKTYHKLVDAIEQHHHNTRKKLIFVIDEAQKLPPEVLEQIRCLTNLGGKSPIDVSFILIAHRDMINNLRHQTMTALRRRLVVHVSMEGLTRDETKNYLHHHTKIAGACGELFEPDSTDPVFNHTRGILRLINKVALDSMWEACLQNQPKVTHAHVNSAINEREEI